MTITLTELIDKIQPKIGIEIKCGKHLLDQKQVNDNRVNVLGIELSGFFDEFKEDQIQLLDKKGEKYLASLKKGAQDKVLSQLFSYNIPALIFTEGIVANERILNLCEANNVPVIYTEMDRWEFVWRIQGQLDKLFAPIIDYRGTMMEVFGIGVLITGKSNVGKSECAIDLLQKGHRLIGDDIIEVTLRGRRVLIARGKYPISSKMELRGIGIIDVVRLSGISAVKDVQKIDLIVGLEKWNPEKKYERLGIDEKTKDILGVDVPYIEIPVAPGRNLAILIEVAAMNLRLRKRGVIPAEELEKQVLDSISKGGNENEKRDFDL